MGKYDDPLTAGRRAAAAALLREAELELQLLKKLSEAADELARIAKERARLALEASGSEEPRRAGHERPFFSERS